MTFNIRKTIKKKFDDIVYCHAGLNKFLRNINKTFSSFTSFRLRPFGVLTVKLKSGVRFKMVTNETSTVTKKIFWNGADGYEYTVVFEALVKKCNAFADVGANLGYYALLAHYANPSLKVYAFEPATAPLHFLRETLKVNGITRDVDIFAIALSDTTGFVEFMEVQNNEKHRYNLGGTGKIQKGTAAHTVTVPLLVPTETMDEFFSKRSLLMPDLIKLDTEGTEDLILNGANHILQQHKPIIICETLFNVIEKQLETIMGKHGYHFYNFSNGMLHRTETIVRDKDDGVSDCFFVHPKDFSKISEFVG